MLNGVRLRKGMCRPVVALALGFAAALALSNLCFAQSLAGEAQVQKRQYAPPVTSTRQYRPMPGPPFGQPPIMEVGGGPIFNVKDFGAVCDGKTDDTTAIQNAYSAAAQAMNHQGGAGIVYFPPSSGYCVVGTLHVPNMGYGQGWLISKFENGLYITDSLYPGNNTAYIGLTSTGLNNSFLWGPAAVWEKPKWSTTSNPIVTLTDVTQAYFEGISIFNNYIYPAVLETDKNGKGVTNVKWKHCSIFGDYNVIPSSPQYVVGFGLNFDDTTIEGVLNVQNFGMLTYRGGYLYRAAISNVGASNTSDFEFNDVLSEGLDQDFLTIDTSGGTVSDITLHRVRIADPAGVVYMVKHINNTGINWLVNIKFDQIPYNCTGNGLIDPTSAPELFSVVCIGSNCDLHALNQAKSTLYMFYGMPPRGPMILYGSQYVPNPLAVITH
jgi:hypothetical protein